ncbi:MAG: type III-A CRISPR-associated protein Csm2 [Schlesneria sp.]
MSSGNQLLTEWQHRYHERYFDEKGHLKLHFVQRAEIEPLAKAMADASPALTRHQIRRFFQHCRSIERRLKASGTSQSTWGQVAPDVVKLDGAASDAFSKSERKIPQIFHDFIKNNVAIVQNERDFREGFLRHFEALIGFGQQYFKEKN